MPRRNHASGLALAGSAALCWGSATVMSKSALATFPPIPLLCVQLAASATLLWGLILIRHRTLSSVRGALRLAWLGLLEPGFAYLLGLSGLADMEAGPAAIIQASESIMIIVLSAVMLRAWPSRRFSVLATFAFAGIALSTIAPIGDVTATIWWGHLLVLVGTLVAACYVVVSGVWIRDEDPIVVVAGQQAVALLLAVFILSMTWHPSVGSGMALIPPRLWAFAALSGIVQYGLAFSLYLAAVKRISTGLAGVCLNAIPVVSLLGAFLWFGETPSTIELIGVSITVAMLILIARLDDPGGSGRRHADDIVLA